MLRITLLTLTVIIALTFAFSLKNAAHGMAAHRDSVNAVLAG